MTFSQRPTFDDSGVTRRFDFDPGGTGPSIPLSLDEQEILALLDDLSMNFVPEHAGTDPASLSAELEISRNGIDRALRSLVQKGHVSRLDTDREGFRITAKGSALINV